MNTNTETMSPADVLARMERMASAAESHRETLSLSYSALDLQYKLDKAAIDAVAELIEREAALVATLAAHRLIPQEHIRLFGMSLAEIRALRAAAAERDALAERVAEYTAARDSYEAATRPSNSHGQPKRLANSDPVLLRYREARAALPAGNPTRTEGYPR